LPFLVANYHPLWVGTPYGTRLPLVVRTLPSS